MGAFSKEGLAVFLVAFWLFLPLPMMGFNVGGVQDITNNENILEVYINLLVFNIPSVNFFILRFVNFLQIITGLTVYLLLRG